MANSPEGEKAQEVPGRRLQPVQGEDAGAPAEEEAIDTLKTQAEEEKNRAEKYLSNWQRAEADLANFKRRTEQDRADTIKFANANVIAKLIPVLDDFERALSAVPAAQSTESWVEGIRLIDRKIKNAFEQEGVTTIEALGKEFDPHVHEAVMREDGEGDTDVVVEELQKGYRLHDRVLRPAMVKVGKGRTQTKSK